MARIFITGSADGLGQLAAKELIRLGHRVVLHARNAARGKDALHAVPEAETVLIADLSSMEETKKLAADVNALGSFDAIIHNAGIYLSSKNNSAMFMVNTMAPYMLTALIEKPKRIVYLSSGMHEQGDPQLKGLISADGDYSSLTYSDTKLHDVLLSKAVARLWPDVFSNAVNPGWVPTKMGGAGAPDDLEAGYQTQVWLAVSEDKNALVSGNYFYHKKEVKTLSQLEDHATQEKFLLQCEQISGIRLKA